MLQHMKDYGVWLMAVFARGVMVFMFNTGKIRMPNCIWNMYRVTNQVVA